ncbi:MAG: ArnT family glycosyltransferase [Thermoanaerobaculia bacterium]
MTGVVFFAGQVSCLLAFVSTAYLAGRLLLAAVDRIRPRKTVRTDDLSGSVVATVLGLIALAHLGFLLGLLGWLGRGPLLFVLVAVHGGGFAIWRGTLAGLRDWWRRRDRRRTARWGAGLLLGATPLLLLASYPPNAFDETLYHLPFARAFAATGSLPILPELRFPVFPQLAELLSAELLIFGGDTATHLVALVANLLTAALLLVWGRDCGSRSVGGLAAAVWLGNPLVVYLGGTGYVEPMLALLATGACHAWSRWQRTGRIDWLVLMALFAAGAADVKYLGLFFVAGLGIAVLLAPSRAATTGRWRAMLVYGLTACTLLIPTYGRIALATGNPLFPYLPGLFGASDWAPHGISAAGGTGGMTVGTYFERLIDLPWDSLVRRSRVGQVPPLSPVYLLFWPFLLATALSTRSARAPFFVATSFVALFPFLPADTRYLVAVLPLYSLVFAVAAQRTFGTGGAPPVRPAARGALLRRRVGWQLLVLFCFLPGWTYAGYRMHRLGRVPVDADSREAFLRRTVPEYGAIARLRALRHPEETVYLLYCEELRDLVPGRVLGDWSGPHRYGLLERTFGDPATNAAFLLRAEVRYLLVDRGAAGVPDFGAAASRPYFRTLFEDEHAALYAVR